MYEINLNGITKLPEKEGKYMSTLQSIMSTCLHDMLIQYWHKSCRI